MKIVLWKGALICESKKDVVSCTTATPVTTVAVLMKLHDLGLIPVLHENTRFLAGVVTDRDLCLQVLATKAHPEHFLANQCMNVMVTFCQPEDTIETALQKMGESQVRRLPVLEKGLLVGIIGFGDIVRKSAATPARIVTALRKIYAAAPVIEKTAKAAA
jgi:CBS domain-containing protein